MVNLFSFFKPVIASQILFLLERIKIMPYDLYFKIHIYLLDNKYLEQSCLRFFSIINPDLSTQMGFKPHVFDDEKKKLFSSIKYQLHSSKITPEIEKTGKTSVLGEGV